MLSESFGGGEIVLSPILFSAFRCVLTFSKNGCHNVAAFSITFVMGRSLCRAAIDICLISSVGGKVFLYVFLVERAKVLANRRTPLLFICHNPHSFNCLFQSDKPLQNKPAIMKANTVITVFVTALSFAVTGLCVDKQATHNSRLAPRTLNAQASSNISVTQAKSQASQAEGLCGRSYGGTGPSRMMTTRRISRLTSSLTCGNQNGNAPRLGVHHRYPHCPLRIRCPGCLCVHKASHQPFTNRWEMPHRLTRGHHYPTPRASDRFKDPLRKPLHHHHAGPRSSLTTQKARLPLAIPVITAPGDISG